MLTLKIDEKCPYGQICPNILDEGSDTGYCQGLNPLRDTRFKCELVREDGIIECLDYICGGRKIFKDVIKSTDNNAAKII